MNERPVEDSWLSSRNDDIALSGKGCYIVACIMIVGIGVASQEKM